MSDVSKYKSQKTANGDGNGNGTENIQRKHPK